MAPEQAFSEALRCQQAGELERAAELYQAILQVAPLDPMANHNLGVVANQLEQHEAALHYFGVALDADPARGQFWLSYVDALYRAGKAEDAQQTLALARQQGLEGESVDALELRLLAGKKFPKPLPNKSKKKNNRSAKHSRENPEPREIETLMDLFARGRVSEVASRSLEMVRRYPRHGIGWKILGVAYQHAGRNADALLPMQKAVEFLPDDVEVHNNLGIVLQGVGRLGEAEASYRRALRLAPHYAQAHGNLGAVLKEAGRLDEAEAYCRRATQLDPKYAKAYNNLGVILHDLKRLDEAETAYRRALEIRPDYDDAHNNLGITLNELGRTGEADDCYQSALAINPNSAEALSNRSIIDIDSGRLDEAETGCRKALELEPNNAETLNNLGVTLIKRGRLDEAVENLHRAVELKPDSATSLSSLGKALFWLGQKEKAADSFRKALQIDPSLSGAYIGLAGVQLEMGRAAEAEANCRQALEITPNSALALNMLGAILMDLQCQDAAEVCFRDVLKIDSANASAHSNLCYCLSKSSSIDAQTLFSEHRRFGDHFEAEFSGQPRQHSNSKQLDRCLRIGLISADLRDHALARFVEPLFAELSGCPQLCLYAYSNHFTEDDITRRLQVHVTHWLMVAGLSDVELTDRIRADGIDILIDLSGHSAYNRLLVFARRPAPIQVSWIGYPGTTGLSAMDYYLADKFFLPPERFAWQFTEKLAYLPTTVPFARGNESAEVNRLPALDNRYVTFGSFNRLSKIGRGVIALWSRLLRAIPDSRLLIAAMPVNSKHETLVYWFAEEGIESRRLDFHERCDVNTYLSLHHRVDVCLDTFPYTGGTTINHALWMGVPTLTMVGETPPSWSGAGLLNLVGLGDYVANDEDDFVAKGLSRVREVDELARLRAGLRERFEHSPLGRPAMIAEAFQRAMRIMWHRWCAGLPPESFEVKEDDFIDTTSGRTL